MTPLSALYRRHRDRLGAMAPLLWVNPPPDLPQEVAPSARGETEGGVCFTQDETTRRALAERDIPVRFGAFPDDPRERWRSAVLSLPREKALVDALAHALAAGARDEAILLAAGETRAGARSAASRLEARFGSVRKIDSARHCVLYECGEPERQPFDAGAYETHWTLERPGGALDVHSLPGVFSHGRLDEGTALLLDQLDAILAARPASAMDVGCGAGVIGAALLLAQPDLRLRCTDSSALALAATRATLAANGLDATVTAADGLRGITERFDLIVSNPPFHVGHRQRGDLGAGVFDGVKRALAPGGSLVLVVNRHLPWPDWLDRTFGGYEIMAANRRYQLLRARAR